MGSNPQKPLLVAPNVFDFENVLILNPLQYINDLLSPANPVILKDKSIYSDDPGRWFSDCIALLIYILLF